MARKPDPDRPGTVYRSRPRLAGGLRPGPPAPTGPPAPGTTAPGDPAPARSTPGSPRPAGAAPDAGSPGPGPPGPGLATARRSLIRRRWPVLAVGVLVVVLVVYPLALFAVAWTHLGRVSAFPAQRPAATPGHTYLVVGSDSRAALTSAERARLGTGQVGGGRTDTIMLLHVPAGSGPTVLVSVPRDSYVSIPGHGMNKINAAYAFGGPQLLIRTLEAATGLRVDTYVETGFGGYADLVDAVGGVNVCVKTAITDAKAHLSVKAGCQTFDGPTALGYARARYSDPLGDLGRVQRQRQILAAIAAKVLSPSTLLMPWRAFSAATAGGDALTADSGISPLGLVRFLQAMRSVAGGGGVSMTVPVARSDLSTPAGLSVEWNRARATELFDALRADDTTAVRRLATG